LSFESGSRYREKCHFELVGPRIGNCPPQETAAYLYCLDQLPEKGTQLAVPVAKPLNKSTRQYSVPISMKTVTRFAKNAPLWSAASFFLRHTL
jgi:hypothetical protein